MANLLALPVTTIDGESTTFGDLTAGRAALVVNVASACGLTPQYTQLQTLQDELGDRGFTVIGFPCNQFGGQEPGTEAEIEEFCSVKYDVTFPLTAKVDVNGDQRDPIYAELVTSPYAAADAGDIAWNFEKFVVGRDGAVVARFSPQTKPDAPEVIAAIESALSA